MGEFVGRLTLRVRMPFSLQSFRPRPGFVAIGLAVGAAIASLGASAARAVTITEFSAGITAGASPQGITAAGDGNMWFSENGISRVARITPTGGVTEFNALNSASPPLSLATGADGNIWYSENSPGGTNNNTVGYVTTAGNFAECGTIPNNTSPYGVTAGPGGTLWYTGISSNSVFEVTTGCGFTSYVLPSANSRPTFIAAGADGNLWFTEFNTRKIGRITPGGTITEFSSGIPAGAFPYGITAGPDGNIWFTLRGTVGIGRITPAGVITVFPVGIPGGTPAQITAGPDGNLWYTYDQARIGRITPAGVATDFSTGITPGATLAGIAAGPANTLWFTESGGDRVARVSSLTSAPPPAAPTLPSNNPQPAITGNATVGQKLSGSTGTWAGAQPISYAYQWERCNPGCSSIAGATGFSYTLTAADASARVRLMITASNTAGHASADSAQVGPVAPSVAQIKALLSRALAPGGKAAKIAAISKARGYSFSIKVLAAGTVTIRWYSGRPGAHLAAAKPRKPVLVASGRLTFSKAGTGKLKVKLTAAGKRLLKHSNSVRLTAQASFASSGHASVSKTKQFTLKR